MFEINNNFNTPQIIKNEEPKFSFIMIVLNGMPFIEYSLKSIYEFSHEIIIVEGAIEKCMFAANPDGSSTDETVKFIKSFPDTQNKIRLVQGKWPEKCQMQNEALKYVTGDYIWLIDSDEVYKYDDLSKIKKILSDNKNITQVNFIPDNFWKGLDYIFISNEFFKPKHHYRRLFKYIPGATFTSHRPPTMIWPSTDKTTEKMNLLDGTTTKQMGITFYHYSYVLEKQVRQKIELYHRYGWGKNWNINLMDWYKDCFMKWTPTNRLEIDSKHSIWTGDRNSHTISFKGSHPEAMIEYIVKKSIINKNTSTPQLIMQHVITTVNEIKTRFKNEQIIAIETGTIRSYQENHLSTYYISMALGNRGRLISVDKNSDSIKRSKNICYQASNIGYVQSDSINYLNSLKNHRFHFAFLDSANKKNVIFEEFRRIIPFMIEGGIIMIDDAGITKDAQAIDESVAAQKGHLVWQFLRACGAKYSLFDTPHKHGTQLKVVLTSDNLAKIKQNLPRFDYQQKTQRTFEISSKEAKHVKVAGDYIKTGMKVGVESSFGSKIQELFNKIKPRKIIETGTYLGTGTTTIITNSLKKLDINDAIFFTIEVNPQNYTKAKQYFETNNMKVNVLNGLSVPRAILPSKEEIAQKTIKDVDYDGIFVDHRENNRVELYYNETNFPNLPDDLLYQCLKLFDFKPDFVLLDSGGHMGYIEFNYLIDNLQGECYIALDDIYHVKHYRSFQKIQEDKRFELIIHSKEKFGFCIAKFKPTEVIQKDINNSQIIISPNNKKKKVLIVRTDSIGDFVIFSGTLPYFRKLYPQSHISIIVQECNKELAEACPYIDEVIVTNRESMIYDQNYAVDFVRHIQTKKFDVAICPVYSRDKKVTDFIIANSGASERIVSAGNDCNMSFTQIQENNSYFTHIVPAKAGTMQEINRNKEFIEGLGIMIEQPLRATIWVEQEQKDFANDLLKKLSIENPIVICPFAQYPIRDWSINKWAQLISNYADYPVLICGSQQNSQMADNIINNTIHPKVYNLCGQTSLKQLAAILERAKFCIGVESAPAHIAAAVDCPHIVIIGGGHFGRFMPYSNKTILVYNKMDCFYCNWRCKYDQDIRCINTITVEMVEQAINNCSQIESLKKHTKQSPMINTPKLAKTTILEEAEEYKTELIRTGNRYCTKKQYDVSIVICTKNRAKLLDQTLTSLKDAVKGINYEVIVIEGNSSDNTQDVLNKHGITKVYNEFDSLGPGRHSWPQLYNFGFSKAKGKWAMYASDDIIFGKDCVTKAINTLNKQKNEVAGGIFFYRNKHSEPGWDIFGIDFTYGPKLLMNYGLVRLDYFRQVGGLDETYRFYCADGDLCFKLYETGKQLIPLSECFIIHDNILDIQKTTHVDKSKNDIELYQKKWKHFVSTEMPEPRRLLWHEKLIDEFNLPLELNKINKSIEHFWHGLAYMQEDKNLLALQEFSQSMKTCQHWLLLWQSAQAAVAMRYYDLATKAIQLVLKKAPHFQEARKFLLNLQNRSAVQKRGTKFIILFNGRAGGTLLQKSLNNHPNIICEDEPISYDPWDKQLHKMKEIFNRFSPYIQACGFKTKMVAIKQVDQQKFADYLHKNSVQIIHLYRDNPIKHALSGYVAEILFNKRKKFNIYNVADRVTPLNVDFQKFQEELLYVIEFERRLFCFVQNFDVVKHISFEHFTTNKKQVLQDIQQWLGVRYYEDIIEPFQKVVPDDLNEAISNYKEFAEKINSIIYDYRMLKIKKEPLFLKYLKSEDKIYGIPCKDASILQS